MLIGPKTMQAIWVLAAAGLLAAAATLHGTLDTLSEQYEINPPDVVENHPAKTLLTMAPGGLRAVLINYFWIRADELKNSGRHHEAMQLAELICQLQPNFPGVWKFHSWNMAWNISVMTHTPEERWLWVYNGARLLRDRGIPLNRKSLVLYQQLGWIFFNKMGAYMDEMHMAYKQRWAAQMQRLLGAAPYETTEEAIEAFRPIAEAPLDKDLRRQGKRTIQSDQLAVLLTDEAVAAYADLLKAEGVQIDEGLLDIYNRLSSDLEVRVVRPGIAPPKLTTERDKKLSALINSDEHSEARTKVLSFIRAQVLWNVYKMDPQWMLGLMERFGPLDWRQVVPHGLYWTTYGIHICQDRDLNDIDSLNTDRLVLFAMKNLAWNGRLTYIENPRNPESPAINWAADWRFIEPTHKEFTLTGEANAKATDRDFAENSLRSGHVNFLKHSIQMLYVAYRRERAQELMDWTKEEYEMSGPLWEQGLEDFVVETLNKEGRPIPDRARSQIASALTVALVQRARGSSKGYRNSIAYARRVYDIYQNEAPDRNKLPAFRILVANGLANMLARPTSMQVNLSLLARSNLYIRTNDEMQRMIYDAVGPALRVQCEAEGIDFDAAFPAPPGIEAHRAGRTGLR